MAFCPCPFGARYLGANSTQIPWDVDEFGSPHDSRGSHECEPQFPRPVVYSRWWIRRYSKFWDYSLFKVVPFQVSTARKKCVFSIQEILMGLRDVSCCETACIVGALCVQHLTSETTMTYSLLFPFHVPLPLSSFIFSLRTALFLYTLVSDVRSCEAT